MELFIRASSPRTLPEGVRASPARFAAGAQILTPAGLAFVSMLEREFGERRRLILRNRIERQVEINAGHLPEFIKDTESIRHSSWSVAPSPTDLVDRRIEIVVPPERKAIAAGLNSGADVCVVDFDDMLSPSWNNVVAAHRALASVAGSKGKRLHGADRSVPMMIRPRGWHLTDKHVLIDGAPVSAAFLDFGLYCFHNARVLLDRGSGPYFCLPKLETRAEAKLWNDIFVMAEGELHIPRGSIRASALIENFLAAFEMHEILYELREHSAGLVLGMWGYVFSMVKKFRFLHEYIFPDHTRVSIRSHLLRACSELMIQTCHGHSAHAIGDIATESPTAADAAVGEEIVSKALADAEWQIREGFDGTRVADPGLVPVLRPVLRSAMPGTHQLQRLREAVDVTAQDLLSVPKGEISEAGVRGTIAAALRYLEAWLGGSGFVRYEDRIITASLAELCRAQLWQWIHLPSAVLADHRRVSVELYERVLTDEVQSIRQKIGEDRFRNGKYHMAVSLLNRLVMERDFRDFLTQYAYDQLE